MSRSLLPEVPLFEDWVSSNPEANDLYERIRKHDRSVYARGTYLGDGNDKESFRVGDHVIKTQKPERQSSFSEQVIPLRVALGIKGVEQVVAISEPEEVIVTKYIPGVSLEKLSAEVLARRYINEKNVAALRSTLRRMQQKGLYVDGASNILVGNGFHIIDPVGARLGDLSVNDLSGAAELISRYRLGSVEEVESDRQMIIAAFQQLSAL